MRVTRFYTTPDGGSSFDEVDIPVSIVAPDAWGNELRTSGSFVSPAVRVFEAPVGAFQDWHNAPRRQLCVMMEGIWEIGTTDGEKRRWGPGEPFLPDDVVGKGHTSEVIEGPVRMVFIPLPDDLDIDALKVASGNRE
ncbi:MAG: hypothetical protein J4F38_14810 [Pseudomonadales bacterium]|nr:hypothetical protein [Pseudomonadales bacterium]